MNNTKKTERINRYNKTKKRLKQDKSVMKLIVGTHNLPITNFIKYLKDNYPSYVNVKEAADANDKNVLYLDDFLQFDREIPIGDKEINVNAKAIQKNNFSLDKLISYSFYMLTNYLFKDNNGNLTSMKYMIEQLKYQVGKDIKRTNITLNEKKYNSDYFRKFDDYYRTADQYYQLFVDKNVKFSETVNYDNINKILLLTCQNMFNLITDLIVIKVNESVTPENCAVFRPDKSISITFTKEAQMLEYNFTSSLIISKDGEPMNPEYPCGEISFIFYIDLLKNTFGFSKFQLSYNINNCGPSKNNDNTENNSEKSNINWKYAVPAAIGTAGIIATPFIIAALGGKRKRKKRKTLNQKTKKRKN
jgi:hypothetical protein